jgi:TonB family protein
MVKGKATCKTLKTIRKQIAEANDIKYEPHECHYVGPCMGTCPACEAEVRYIEQQLSLRRQLGKAVAIIGLSAGLSALTATPAMAQTPVKNNQEEKVLRAGEVVVQEEPKDENYIFGVVEQMPSFPGGNKALMKFLDDNLRYPAEARAMGIQGRVVVTFVVERDGNIDSIKVIKKVSPELDREALRVIRLMPKWNPGKQNGKTVRTKYTIPVIFKPS